MSTEFNTDQFSEAYSPGVERDFWHLSRNRIILSYLRCLGPGRVLDVGCGRGILVNYLLSEGVDCFGVELGDPRVPENLHGRLICNRASNDLPKDLRLSIDTLVLADVIEHLPDPATFLQALMVDFPNARGIVITVPARTELWSNYDEHYGHYRRYDLNSLKSEFAAAGIAIVRSSYMFRPLYLAARLLLASQRKRSTRIPPPRLHLLHRLAAGLLYADFACLPAGWYGSSAICAGQRLPG
jgi:hypothetical protein